MVGQKVIPFLVQIAKKLAIFSLLVVGVVIFFAVFLSFWAGWQFARGAHLKPAALYHDLKWGWQHPDRNQYHSFLLLGLDQRPDNPTLLTDTILLVTVNTKTGKSLLFSLPRDLWLEDQRTKINALYYYGRRRDPQHPFGLLKTTVERLTGQKIDQVALLTMANVRDLIDFLGGIDIYVERSFRDSHFPRDDGSHGVRTVSFQKGWHHFSGQRALEYMRSRKSSNPQEGNDLARERRQQEVLLALEKTIIKARPWWQIPYFLGQMYNFVQKNILIRPRVTLATIAQWRWLRRAIKQQPLRQELLWQGDAAILETGIDPYYGSWILQPRRGDYGLIKQFFQTQLRHLQ